MVTSINTQLWLAPMEGVVDPAMRQLLTDIGGIDVCVTEFVRVTQQPLPKRTLLKYCPELSNGAVTKSGAQVRIQLLGSNVEAITETALRAVQLGAKQIDMNFGCPAKTVNKHLGGAALLKHPELISEILTNLRTTIAPEITLSAKIRLGFERVEESYNIVSAINASKIDQLTIHARTKTQGYKPPAYWAEIRRIKQHFPDLDIIANGEIWTVDDFIRCQKESGCNKFMLGRGILANPFLAKQIKHYLQSGRSLKISWLDVAPLLLINATKMIENAPKTEYFSARTKQWLNYLRLQFPEAKTAFTNLRTIRCPHAMLHEVKKLSANPVASIIHG